MALREGEELGPYRILGELGSGGMGEVYRARDTRLDRDVAVKVLPAALAGDESSLARFEREAKVVAALSHPNILAIHDFGKDDEGRAYAVTELLDGDTLRARLSSGALPSRKAVEIGVQIAQGLGAAHEKGVVHRDLKPENLFLTRDGRAKILDFGLAARAESASVDLTQTPTRTKLTEPGSVMGTVGYMSPEQVKGENADGRSDIFSFGTILHEMLAGRRAFQRETAAEIMTAILREEPSEAELPTGLGTIVRRCMEKVPEERFQSARDLAFALEAAADPSSARLSRPDLPPVPAARPTRRLPLAMLIPALVVLVAGAFLAGRWLAPGRGDDGPTAMSLDQLTYEGGVESQPRLFPDGRSFVFVAARGNEDRDIYLQRIGGETSINLTATSDTADIQPAISPDGELIAFRSEREGGGIFVMGATGESVRRLTESGFNPAWSPDGSRLAVAAERIEFPYSRLTNSEISLVDVRTGESTPLGIADAVQPRFSPDGRLLAYWGLPAGTGRRVIYTLVLEGGKPLPLTDDAFMNWNPVWSDDGHWLYFASDRGGPMNIWRIPVNPATGAAISGPRPVSTSTQQVGMFDLGPEGRILLTSSSRRIALRRFPLDVDSAEISGEWEVLLTGSRRLGNPRVSPDGKWIAMQAADPQEDLVVVRADGTEMRRLMNDSHRDRGPRWLPDSDALIFFSDRGGRYELWKIRRDGSGLEQVTDTRDREVYTPVVSPDGTRAAVQGSEIGTVDLSQPWPVKEIETLQGPHPENVPAVIAWSPDGSSLVLMSNSQTYLHDLASGENRLLDKHVRPLGWIPGTRYVLGKDADGPVRVDSHSGEVRRLRGLPSLGSAATLDLRDGFLYEVRTQTEGDLWLLRPAAASGTD